MRESAASRRARSGRTNGSGGTCGRPACTIASPAVRQVQTTELPSPPPKMPSAGRPEPPEDQRPADDGIEDDAERADDEDPRRSLERREEVAHRLEQQERQNAPHVAVEEQLGVARQRRLLPEHQDDRFRVPQHRPAGERDAQRHPARLAERAADIAHRARALARARSPSSATTPQPRRSRAG